MHPNRFWSRRWLYLAVLGLALTDGLGVAFAQTDDSAGKGPPLPKLTTAVAFPNLKFDRPVEMACAKDESNLLFVAEQKGVIQSFPNDPATADAKVFLDISAKVFSPSSGGHNEEGLLGLTFHPNVKQNREFFVYYSSKEGPTGRRSIVARYRVSKDDPRRADAESEERVWIGPPDPHGNHNGGGIGFGPDGYLYITLGDSGAADDPLTTGQNPKDFFGSILRIDVDHPSNDQPYGIPKDNPRLRDPEKFAAWAPEVYCIGLRNVWRFSFDRQTGTLWAGDVGQNKWEMVHIIANGGNYGWSINEGLHPFRTRQKADGASKISKPLAEYPHSPNLENSGRRDDGKSITGGFVYRGKALPELAGVYVYGDFDTGRVWGLREQGGQAAVNAELIELGRQPKMNIASFGEDPAGELFILAFDGKIYRLVSQQTPAPADASAEAFTAGEPLKLTKNARTYGGFRFAESISYDAVRDLYVAVNAGMPQKLVPNDGYVALINPDGTTHTLKWIGVNRKGLTLNHPLGSDIMNGLLYVADIDTVRWFDMATGQPRGSVKVEGATSFNDIEVAEDGTIYATQTGDKNNSTWRLYKIAPDGKSSILVEGAPLMQPNGVAFDPKGNVVVVNIGSKDVLTFSPSGQLLLTEESIDAGNDGLAILPDGTKYVSSVRQGTVARIRPGQKAESIASGIPSAASMTYDPKRNRLVIPMNDWNAITFVELGPPADPR